MVGGTGGAAQPVRGNYDSYPVSRTTTEERAERSKGWRGGGAGGGASISICARKR